MRLLIDGHNLIGQMSDIRLGDPNDEAELVLKLRTYCMRHKHRILLIFDNGLPGGLSALSTSQVEVRFAPPGMPADTLLIKRIREVKDVNSVLVITSDRVIREVARQQRIRSMPSAEFATLLHLKTGKPRPIAEDRPESDTSSEDVEYWLKRFSDSSGSHS
jgi:predicted RNA-binding protein with PIN domain